MLSLIILFILNILSIASTQQTQQVLNIGYYNDCEGADAANYTLLIEGTLASDCSRILSDQGVQLIRSNSTNDRSVMLLQMLASSQYPGGALNQIETLWLVTNGPLAARYVYQKVIYQSATYLKKCSSVLGYSFVSSRSAVLLISQNLDLNIFLAPNGAFETFKRGSTTTCRGRVYLL